MGFFKPVPSVRGKAGAVSTMLLSRVNSSPPRFCEASLTGGAPQSSDSSTARNASCGTSTWPICFIRFFPSACFAQSFRLRVMSPP